MSILFKPQQRPLKFHLLETIWPPALPGKDLIFPQAFDKCTKNPPRPIAPTREGNLHLSIGRIQFSVIPECQQPVKDWIAEYTERKPKRFAQLTTVLQTSLWKMSIWYSGTQKIYHVKLNSKEYYDTDEWKEKRDEVIERDGNRCVLCAGERRLVIHHKTYENFGNEPLEDLTTLCWTCHARAHKHIPRLGGR